MELDVDRRGRVFFGLFESGFHVNVQHFEVVGDLSKRKFLVRIGKHELCVILAYGKFGGSFFHFGDDWQGVFWGIANDL